MPRLLFLAIKLIAFLYLSNSKCMGAQLWNSQTGFKLKKKHYKLCAVFEVLAFPKVHCHPGIPYGRTELILQVHSKTIHTSVKTIHTSVKTIHTSVKTIHTSVKTIHTSVKTIHTSVKTIHTSVKVPMKRNFVFRFFQ